MKKSRLIVIVSCLFCFFSLMSCDALPPADIQDPVNIQVPIFVHAESAGTRAISFEVYDMYSGQGELIYYSAVPLIASFESREITDGSYSVPIATTWMRFSVVIAGRNITYEGAADGVYVKIVLDTVDGTFYYRQATEIDCYLRDSSADNEPQHISFVCLTEGDDMAINPDGGVKGSYRSHYFRHDHSQQSKGEILCNGELYSNTDMTMVAMLKNQDTDLEYSYDIPSMSEMLASSVPDTSGIESYQLMTFSYQDGVFDTEYHGSLDGMQAVIDETFGTGKWIINSSF